MSKHTYTDEQLIEAVKTSECFHQVLILLKIIPAGGNYYTVKRKIKNLNLDISHFRGKIWNRGKVFPKIPIDYYIKDNHPIKSWSLKKRLFKEGFKSKICEMCHLSEWLGNPISLELDHIDGNHDNNLLENLRILCPNCHATTDTYRGRKKKLKLSSVLPSPTT